MTSLEKHLEEGQRVTLDEDLRNTSTVTVVSQTSGRMYCRVTNGDESWDVMTNRLTELK